MVDFPLSPLNEQCEFTTVYVHVIFTKDRRWSDDKEVAASLWWLLGKPVNPLMPSFKLKGNVMAFYLIYLAFCSYIFKNSAFILLFNILNSLLIILTQYNWGWYVYIQAIPTVNFVYHNSIYTEMDLQVLSHQGVNH